MTYPPIVYCDLAGDSWEATVHNRIIRPELVVRLEALGSEHQDAVIVGFGDGDEGRTLLYQQWTEDLGQHGPILAVDVDLVTEIHVY